MLLKDSSGNSLSLSKDDSLKLELNLNTSKYGKEWIHIGDKLYHFYTGEINDKELIVTPYQFKFLIDLLKPMQPN
tara:strand:- start:226 stop:450 length:225 start_codon:yes stop_codon:yes gene_type:complete